jgi:signal transduction histidine kinase
VSDTGSGIPKEDLPKVFNKFFRSGSLLTYNKTGVGLGLYLGKEIVENHGGKISVDSTEGMGTTFTVELPIIKENIL